MTIEERNNKLKHFITCLKCEVSGKCCDDNCSTQYDAGNMGEIIENLEAISKALDQEPIKPMVEIDLYSVIKQKYIEREVLDKIDEIITDALDNSTDQKESQTLRWVLDKISEVVKE